MKRNLVNFTRGSQLLGHFGFMFASGLNAPLIIAVTLLIGMSYGQVTTNLSDHQRYLVGMNLYAALYGFMELDPAKLINLDLGSGASVEMAISGVQNFPAVVRAMDILWTSLRTAFMISALLFLPAFILFYWMAEYFGGRSKESKHERGAQLAPLPALEAEISCIIGLNKRGESPRRRQAVPDDPAPRSLTMALDLAYFRAKLRTRCEESLRRDVFNFSLIAVYLGGIPYFLCVL